MTATIVSARRTVLAGTLLSIATLVLACSPSAQPTQTPPRATAAAPNHQPASPPEPAPPPPSTIRREQPPSPPPTPSAINCQQPPSRDCCQAETPECESCKRSAAAEYSRWEQACRKTTPPPPQPMSKVDCSTPAPNRICCQAMTESCLACKRRARQERAAWDRQCRAGSVPPAQLAACMTPPRAPGCCDGSALACRKCQRDYDRKLAAWWTSCGASRRQRCQQPVNLPTCKTPGNRRSFACQKQRGNLELQRQFNCAPATLLNTLSASDRREGCGRPRSGACCEAITFGCEVRCPLGHKRRNLARLLNCARRGGANVP